MGGRSPKAPSSEGAFRCQDLPQDPDGLVDLACRVEGGGGEAEGAGGEGTGRFVGQGAQWRPARVQTPCSASRAASVSQSIVSARTESVPLCPSPYKHARRQVPAARPRAARAARPHGPAAAPAPAGARSAVPRQDRRCRRRSASRPRRGPAAPAACRAGARRCRCRPPEACRASGRRAGGRSPAGRRAPYVPAYRRRPRQVLPD